MTDANLHPHDEGNTLTKEVPSAGEATYYEWTQANMMKWAAGA